MYLIMELVAGQDMLGFILDHAKKARLAPAGADTRRGMCPPEQFCAFPVPSFTCWRAGVPEEVARTLFADVTAAVVFLHSAGLVHRDMKPGASVHT